MAFGKERTSEFFSIVESIRNRSLGTGHHMLAHASHNANAADRQRLLPGGSGGGGSGSSNLRSHAHTPSSEFAKAAFIIARDINNTMAKVQKFAALAKRKSLFDDRPVEINELVYIIKQDIARLNLQIGKLSDVLALAASSGNGFGSSAGAGASSASSSSSSASSSAATAAAAAKLANNRQTKEHSHNVITSLQSRLATASDQFKNVLEVRFRNMKEQQSRRDQYSFSGTAEPLLGNAGVGAGAGSSSGIGGNTSTAVVSRTSSALGAPAISDSPLYNPERRSTPAPMSLSNTSSYTPIPSAAGRDGSFYSRGDTSTVNSYSSDHHLIDMGATQSLQQATLIPTSDVAQMEYIESRSQAIESIEQAISELGQIYQNFAVVLATQREMVQRIDDNVQDVHVNVEGAHAQLVKYYQNISSNRALMLKLFAVVLTFFLIFVAMT